MRPDVVRVVYDNRPYLVTRNDDGSLERAYGPFVPGAEPSLADCGPANQVGSPALLSALESLLPVSPALPSHDDTLAGG